MHCNLRQPNDAQSLSALISLPVPSLKSLSQSVAENGVSTAYMLRYAVTLNFDPMTLTFDFDICSVPAVPWSNSIRNLSTIGLSAAELLRSEYLTLWTWTCITYCAMLSDSLDKVYTQSIIRSWNVTIFWCNTSYHALTLTFDPLTLKVCGRLWS